jgi:hypothetical protein
LQKAYPPRPRWNHQCVKEAAAREFVDEVRVWADDLGLLNSDVEDREFLAVLALALIESPDAYHAGRYMEDFIGWPVNGDLIRILDRAYGRMKFITSAFVQQWVVEHNVRLTANKGDSIRCKIGDLELSGKVVDVIKREARAIFIPNGADRHMIVLAEEIIQVLPPRKPKKKKDTV